MPAAASARPALSYLILSYTLFPPIPSLIVLTF